MTIAIGVLPLLNSINNAVDVGGLLIVDAVIIARLLNPQVQWGIFSQGTRIVEPDSIVAFDFKKEYRLAEYPMERGAFQQYNKVTMPYDVRVTMTKGGTLHERQTFLAQIADAAQSMSLYSVVTPEVTYLNANIAHYDYRRTSTNGVTLLTVDVWLSEIRITEPSTLGDTADPSAQPVSNTGYVQATQGAPISNIAVE